MNDPRPTASSSQSAPYDASAPYVSGPNPGALNSDAVNGIVTYEEIKKYQDEINELRNIREQLSGNVENLAANVAGDVHSAIRGIVGDITGNTSSVSLASLVQDKTRRRGLGYLLIAGATVGLLVEGMIKRD